MSFWLMMSTAVSSLNSAQSSPVALPWIDAAVVVAQSFCGAKKRRVAKNDDSFVNDAIFVVVLAFGALFLVSATLAPLEFCIFKTARHSRRAKHWSFRGRFPNFQSSKSKFPRTQKCTKASNSKVASSGKTESRNSSTLARNFLFCSALQNAKLVHFATRYSIRDRFSRGALFAS